MRPSTPESPVRSRLDALQALRALAAGLVVLDHAAVSFLERFHPDQDIPAAVWFAGSLGVKVFFGISGYIIYLSTQNLPGGVPGVLDFFRRRLIRVVPLYWLATAAYGLRLTMRGEAPALAAWLLSLFFVPYANPAGLMRPIVGVGWSLNFEMFFYAVMGTCLLLPRRWSAWATLALLGLCLALRATGVIAPSAVPPVGAAAQADLRLLCDPILGFFMAGVLVAKLEPTLRHWLGGRALGFWSTVLASCALPAAMAAAVWWHLLPVETADAWAPVVCVAALVLSVLEQHGGAAPDGSRRLGAWRSLLVHAGDASYSTYIIHTFALNAMLWVSMRIVGDGLAAWSAGRYALVMTLVGTAIGWMAYQGVERPMMRWLNRRTSRPIAARGPAARPSR